MNPALRKFRAEAVLLGGVSLLLAIAENTWWYMAAVLVGGAIGYWIAARGRRPPLSAQSARIFGMVAFGILLIEWGWFIHVPTVMALSHFMILICVSKWLQSRTHRDDAMMIILLLLLLVVGAIVGGNLVFPIVLTAYLVIGCRYLIRHHLYRGSARASLYNAHVLGAAPPAEPRSATTVQGLTTHSLSISLAALLTGAVLFVAMPRVGAGMFGQIPQPISAGTLTGLSRSIEFSTNGPIVESDRLVMRVSVTDETGQPIPAGTPLYLRGDVLDRYSCRFPPWNRGWGFRRASLSEDDTADYELLPWGEGPPRALLFPERSPLPGGPMIVQKYHLEPTDDLMLFACYPAVEIASSALAGVRKAIDTQTLQVSRPIRKSIEYTIRSPAVPVLAAKALAAERGSEDVPAPPDPELPPEQRARILDLIEEQTRGIGPLDVPENRLAFARRLESFLQSGRFTYTLEPPPLPAKVDPVSHFLLESRRGHCEYFASALAIMCQLKRVPARVAIGYVANEFNSLGGLYLIRKKHAHAWVEVFVPGEEWVALDPTPISERQTSGLRLFGMRILTYIDYLQFRWADGVLSFDSETRRRLFEQFTQWLRRPAQDQRTLIGGLAAFVRELFGGQLDLSWKERLVYWVFTLLVVVLVVLLTYVLASVGRRLTVLTRRLSQLRRVARAGRGREVEFYHRFCRCLADLGVARRPDQTPAEFAAELAGREPTLREAPALVRAYYQVAFGDRRLSPEQARSIEAFLNDLRGLVAGRAGPRAAPVTASGAPASPSR